MSAPIQLPDLLSLIENAALQARLTHAQASILTAQMDLRASAAGKAHGEALTSLLSLTAILHQGAQPAPNLNGTGRLSLTD